jgi:hypothetical protein
MKDAELNEALKRATVPERGADYWEQFPNQVTAEIERRRQTAGAAAGQDSAWAWTSTFRLLISKPAFALEVAAICLVLGLVLGSWNGHRSPGGDPQLAQARKYFHELEALFPHQLQAVVFDQQGTHLMLAPEPNLPASPPLYLKVCGPKGCQRFVTFSGQQIRVNGDVCDVLADGRGGVLLVGRQALWAGAQASGTTGRYRIEAKPLEASL